MHNGKYRLMFLSHSFINFDFFFQWTWIISTQLFVHMIQLVEFHVHSTLQMDRHKFGKMNEWFLLPQTWPHKISPLCNSSKLFLPPWHLVSQDAICLHSTLFKGLFAAENKLTKPKTQWCFGKHKSSGATIQLRMQPWHRTHVWLILVFGCWLSQRLLCCSIKKST